MSRVTLVLVLFVGACTSTTPAPADVEKAATAPGPKASEPTADQWTCAKDADCTQTCALGAVSRAWLERNRDADPCDDGCGWKSGMQACRDGECVTLTAEGDIDEACTKKPVPAAR
jgi:hypothetical protein